MLVYPRGSAAIHTSSHRLHTWLAAPFLDALLRRAAAEPAGQGRLVWVTTLPGALSAMALATAASLYTALGWLLATASAPSSVMLDAAALTLEPTALFGSLVNLVAVVGGCWSAVPSLARPRRRRGARPVELPSL